MTSNALPQFTSAGVSGTIAAATAAVTWWRMGLLGSLEILGNGSSDVSINFWLRAFPVGAADFTVLLLSGMFYALLMVPLCAVMWARAFRRDAKQRHGCTTPHESQASIPSETSDALMTSYLHHNGDQRPSQAPSRHRTEEPMVESAPPTARLMLMSLFCDKTNIMWMCLVTLCDLSINIFGTYAAGHIPVMLQIILKSAEPFLCWVLSCLVWRGEYTQKSFLLVALPTVAMCIAAGAVVAETWIALQAASEKTNVTFWVTVFGLRVLSSAAYNVSQGTLMRRNRLVFGRLVDPIEHGGGTTSVAPPVASCLLTPNLSSSQNTQRPPAAAAAEGSKSHMMLLSTTILAVDATMSLLFLLAFGPLIDTITYGAWGSSVSVADAWANFSSGAQCVFSSPINGECPNNLWLALLTNGAWVVVYVVDTFLNEISPALNSLLNMLSSPLTTIFLVVFPSLDLGATLHRDSKTVLLQCLGIVLMCISVGLFFHYERCKSNVIKKKNAPSAGAAATTEIGAASSATSDEGEGRADDVHCGVKSREGSIN
jgi:hypothetical protein